MSEGYKDFETLQEFCDWAVDLIIRCGGTAATAYKVAAVLAADPALAHLDKCHPDALAIIAAERKELGLD